MGQKYSMEDAPTLIGMHRVFELEDSPLSVREVEERLAQNPNITLADIQAEITDMINASTLNVLATHARKRETGNYSTMSYHEREFMDSTWINDQEA